MNELEQTLKANGWTTYKASMKKLLAIKDNRLVSLQDNENNISLSYDSPTMHSRIYYTIPIIIIEQINTLIEEDNFYSNIVNRTKENN